METKTIYNEILNQLCETCSCISEKNIEEFIEEIFCAKRIFFGGAGRSLLMMRSFAMRLMQFGFQTYVVGDTTTPAIREGDLLILGTNSGETNILKSHLSVAIENQARVAVITSSSNSTIASKSDCTIVVGKIEDKEKIQSKGSTFEQALLILCDSIVSKVFRTGRLTDKEIDEFIVVRHANLE